MVPCMGRILARDIENNQNSRLVEQLNRIIRVSSEDRLLLIVVILTAARL